MNIAFHYFVIKILAEKAGFNPTEAQIIAYASQYVDDAVEHKEIKVNNLEKLQLSNSFKSKRINGDMFNPICTAHEGLSYINCMDKNAQMYIYISFHFLPPEQYLNVDDFSYVVQPDGKLANELINTARTAWQNDRSVKNLIKLGVILHSYADTWAHSNFSGRHGNENDIDEIIKIIDGKAKTDGKHWLRNLLPDVGHAEADIYPDLTNLIWNARFADRRLTDRDNSKFFLDSAKAIYNNLIACTNEPDRWDDFSNDLLNYLKTDKDDDSYNSSLVTAYKYFPDIAFSYSKEEWRRSALSGIYYNWKSKDFNDNKFEYQYFIGTNNNWFLFHEAAFEQRAFILNSIKPL